MASSMFSVIEHLRKAASLREDAELTDGQLLERFVKNHDRAALEVLVQRHGRMVWGVCCRILRDGPDAEDAFQASFLVLVRRANAAPRDTVANWLYGVAHQTALKARATIGTRKVRETQVTDMPQPNAPPQVLWDDVQCILDEELSRLSDKHRAVIVMCDLEGKTRAEVAQRLGVPEGTVASRLARAHAMLAKRLRRRGMTLSSGAVAGVLAQQAAAAGLPGETVAATITSAAAVAGGQVAPGAIAPKVAALVEGVLKAMLLSKLKMGAVWFLVGLLIIASGLLAYQEALGQAGAGGLSREALPQARGSAPEGTAKKDAGQGKVAPKPTSWFEGSLAELNAPGVPGKNVFGRIKLQNAKDAFNFDITTETKIFLTIGDKQQPAQFTDLTRDSTIRAGYNGLADETHPPVAHAQEIVIVKAAPIPAGAVFEGDAEVGPGVPFQRKDYGLSFLLHLSKQKDRIVFHVPNHAILVKVVDGKQRPAVIADITNGSKLRVIAPGGQDDSDPPQMAAEQILILDRQGQAKKPNPLPDAVVTAWQKAGVTDGWMRSVFWGMTFHNDPEDVKPGDLAAFRLFEWKAGVLSKLPAPDQAFGICLGNSNVTDAGLKELARFKQLQMLDISLNKITDAGLKNLGALKRLRTLYLTNTEVTDKGLKELVELKQLQCLTLRGTEVTDAGLKELAGFDKLDTLTLSEHMTNAGMKDLAKLKGLRELDLRSAKVTDAGLKDLAGLEEMQVLLVPQTISDTGLKELAKFKQMELLDLSYSRVSDVGMKELAGLSKLKWLDIRDTAVTDHGLMELAALKRLRHVNLSTANKVTAKAISSLEQAVPGLRVWVWDPR
jgi:RNA polymerase sigma factor (sigma-70 family)